MSKVQILGPRVELDEVIKALHAIAVVHIETTASPVDLDDTFFRRMPLEKEKLDERERLSRGLERLRNLFFLLNRPQQVFSVNIAPDMVEPSLKEAAAIEERVKRLHASKVSFTEELTSIGRYEKVLRGFATLVTRLGGLKNFDIIGLTLDKSRSDVLSLLEVEVTNITGGSYEIYEKSLDETTTGVVFAYPSKFSQSIRALISGEAINEIRLPETYGDLPLMDVIGQMSVRREKLPGLIGEVEEEIGAISEQWYARIEGLIDAVEDLLEEIGVLAYCSQTRYAFIIEGWAPKDMLGAITGRFHSIFGERVLIREVEVREEESSLIPVYLKNPSIIRPFEIFLHALPTPRYGSVDPTPFVAFFFPTFFGLIVGDIGYGVVVFLLALFLRRLLREKPFFRDAAFIGTLCGVASIVFGFVFGEFFGDLGERLHIIHPLVFDRVGALKAFLLITLGIGTGHVMLGFLIAIVNYFSRGKKREAVAKLSFLLLTVSSIFTLAVYKGFLPVEMKTPGVVLLVICFIFVIIMEGVIGPLEFIKTFGNIVSYMRIMAVGMASVVMAMVANQMGGLMGSVFLGVIVAGVMHTLNIALVILSPSIQSMRLQYVEFFSKFYEGGGREYKPFKKR